MSLGDYPDRIRIEQRVVIDRTAAGEETTAWQLVRLYWSKYFPLRGRELMAAQQQQTETVTSFRLYYTARITADMRVVFKGAYFDIESIVDIGGRREEIELMCKTGLNDG